MAYFSTELGSHFDALLAASEARLARNLRQPVENSLAVAAEAAHEVSDFKDAASANEELAITELQANRFAMELVEVQAARRRIERGTFGLCADCGTSVDLARLMAIPATSCCLDCQSKREKNPAPAG